MRGQRCVDKEPEPFQIGQQYIYFNYSSSDRTKDSAVGASATASTANPRSSRTYFAVVGPMAASRARRNPFPLPEGAEDSPAVIEKCSRNAGMTWPAAEGAKRTIHHGSSSSSSEMNCGRHVNSPARYDARNGSKKETKTYLIPLATHA